VLGKFPISVSVPVEHPEAKVPLLLKSAPGAIVMLPNPLIFPAKKLARLKVIVRF
jgi:hypothetical protein